MLFIGVGTVLIGAAAVWNHLALGWWLAPILGGCLAAVAAAFLFRRKLGLAEVELASGQRRLAEEQTRLASERSQFEELRLAMQNEMEQQARRLDKREQALTDRLVTYHEWMEFPQPVELGAPAEQVASLSELARKDRQMLALLQAETKILYDNILQNKYAAEGKVLLPLIRTDAIDLVTRVARIYQPSVEQPLLEASLARVLRAASRASMQALVVLDELPLSVHDASFSTIYGYVRRAVDTWRMYKSTEPYWPYVNTAYYLSRFALGSNPLALGTWWFVSSLGTRGAQAVATHLVNRQALAMLSDVVRVIGFEVAGVYGGDFRHRDANWIYAAELTELVSQFPLSRDSLAHALREVGALQLRSEYDRMFLYRCLAGGKSAEPARYHATEVLTMEERRAVATRLERFLEAFVHGKLSERVAQWKTGAEGRLGIKLAVAIRASAVSVREQIVDAAGSLASFLVSLKQVDPPEAAKMLAESAILRELPEEERAGVLEKLARDASFFFEHPDLDPDSDLVQRYLEDLAALNARTSPREAGIDDTLMDVAAYLRRPAKEMPALVEKHYGTTLADKLPGDAPLKRVPVATARAALDLLSEPGEAARFIYGPAKVEFAIGSRDAFGENSLWLLGVGQRLILFVAGDQPRVVWRGMAADVHAEQVRQVLLSQCRLTGGKWELNGAGEGIAIRVPSGLMSGFGIYFRPLLEMLGRGGGAEH